MSTISKPALEERLLKFFEEMADAKDKSNFEEDKSSFVFHMTDWAESLPDLQRLYDAPEQMSEAESSRILRDLFYHLLPHLNAAAEIYDDAPEIYNMHNKRKPHLK